MDSSADAVIALISTIIADVIVGGGWVVVAIGILVFLRALRLRKLAELPPGTPEEPSTGLKIVFAGLALMFWPAGLAMGLYFVTKPATVRAGVLCLQMLVLNVSFAVVAAIAIVTAVAVMAPQVFVP